MLFGQKMMAGASHTISYERAVREAAQRYERCYERGVRRRVLRRLIGASSFLAVAPRHRSAEVSHSRVGIDETGTVMIDRIRGSEAPSGEFDDRFRPVRTHNRDTWIAIAARFLRGNALPVTVLVRIENELYVRSGHAAISVAREFGQTAIDATIVHLAGRVRF